MTGHENRASLGSLLTSVDHKLHKTLDKSYQWSKLVLGEPLNLHRAIGRSLALICRQKEAGLISCLDSD